MTVINPNSVAGINSITVQSGNALSVHKSDGTLIRTITESSGISTFTSVSVGSATTDNSANNSINIGLGASISQHATNSLSLGTGGDERLRITSDGNVGINDTNPAADLSVKPTAAHCSAQVISGDGSTILNGTAVQGSEGRFGMNSNHPLAIYAGGSERLRITGIGSVGVGINAPIAQFQVNSTKNAETDRFDARNYHLALRNPDDDTGEAIGLSFGITSNAEKVGAAILHERESGGSQGSLQFYVSSDGNSISEAMRINANQNVQFTPEGSTSNPYLLVDSTGDNIRLSSQKSSGDGGLIISTQDSGSAAERVRITGVGSFGVGTGGINVESMIHIDRNVSTAYDASAVDAQRGGTATLNITNANTTNNSFAQIAFRCDDTNQAVARIAAVKRSTNSTHLVFVTEHGGTPAERMRINSDGFIGVGGGSPASDPRGQFVINSEKDALTNANCNDPHHFHFVLKNDNDTNGESIGMCFSASSTVDRVGAAIIHNREGPGSVGDLQFYTCASEGTTTHVGRFRSNGDFTTKNEASENRQTAGFTARNGDSVQATRSAGTPLEICRTTNTGNLVNFFSGTVNVASITTNGSSITYNTSSDYRLKENVVTLSDGITRLKTLKPYKFNFISDETKTVVDGFFAHEVSSVVPQSVIGEKDAPIDEEGKGYQQIDHSKLVPLLTAALQEAITKIETLETKVAALEGG